MIKTQLVPPDADTDTCISELEQLATAIGQDPQYVQGAGGNLSAKADGTLWVKASGTRFKDATSGPIFVQMDLAAVRNSCLEQEDLRHAVIGPAAGAHLRPSIEAAFHALLPQRYVLHVHSVGAIALGVVPQRVPSHSLDSIAAVTVVGYHRPGLPLARALAEAGVDEVDAASDHIVLLANHGLIVASPSAQRCLELVREVEGALRPRLVQFEDDGPTSDGWRRVLPSDSVSAAARTQLCGGVLTPDEAVFLGTEPFSTDSASGAAILLDLDGAAWADVALSADALEIASSMLSVGSSSTGPASYLTHEEVGELTGWDAEQWRKAMQR